MSSLPQDGNTNFSAIFYHDLAPLMGPLAERMKNMGGEMSEKDRQAFGSIDANAPPTLAYAYAQGDRITIAANTEGGAFGLSPASLRSPILPDRHLMNDGRKDGHKRVSRHPKVRRTRGTNFKASGFCRVRVQ